MPVAPENAPERREIPAIEVLQVKMGALISRQGFGEYCSVFMTRNPKE